MGNKGTSTSSNNNNNNSSSSNGNGNTNTNTINGTRAHPASRDSRHGAYGFFSSGQNTHHFESYLSRKGHQDILPSHQVKPASERVFVPLPKGTGKPEGVWNAFNGSYTQQDWANYARDQAGPVVVKRPASMTAAAATTTTAAVRVKTPTTPITSTVTSRHVQTQAQKPWLPTLTNPAPAPAPASPALTSSFPASPFPSSSSSSLSSTSKPSVTPMSPPPQSPTLLIDLEFSSTLPTTPTVNSSVFADLLDLDFTDCMSTTSTTTTMATAIPTAAAAAVVVDSTSDAGAAAASGTATPKNYTETGNSAVPVEESTLIDFSDTSAGTIPEKASSLLTSSVSFGEAGPLDDHLATDGYTTDNTDYNDDDSDSSDDDDDHHHHHLQIGVDKSTVNDKDFESDTKGIFVDFATLANLRTELLDANVTWEDLLTRLKGGRA
ncbi:hypothetical protein EC991_005522 [Linnemannia zychae]|nr:hypothetical protein EC991_005522 [Linnemannia zychae]